MRFAISAVAAISGLVLLGLAFYGQPALYLHQAREQWNVLVDAPAADQPREPDHDAAADGMAKLQLQVTQLENQLAERKAVVPQAAPSPPPEAAPAARQPEAPAMQRTDRSAALQVETAQLDGQRNEAPQPAPAQSAAAQSGPRQSSPSLPGPTPSAGLPAPQLAKESQAEQPAPRFTAPAADPVIPTVTIPEHREATSGDTNPRKTESAKTELAKPEQPKPEPPKSGRSSPPKVALQKPVPPPPALPSPPRQDVDDAQSVLARLRQLAPPADQPADPTPPVEPPKPRQVQSPSLPKLIAARAAMASGRIEDARRLLQEAQLQLVFRPVNAAGDDLPAAGKGAADVARALDALSANDLPLSRRYIDVAKDDLSGSGTSSPFQASDARPTGYAPAYPPR